MTTSNKSWQLLAGDCLQVLATLPAESVQTCITSPPYWGLRDYGTAAWQGGSLDCDHKKNGANKIFGNPEFNANRPSREQTDTVGFRDMCGKCGATRIDSQLGLEATPEAYVASMVAVFREVRRVLRHDGTLWLNLGDSYTSGGRKDRDSSLVSKTSGVTNRSAGMNRAQTPDGLKPKDLVGIPWRVAFALQADGWYLRQDIIWAKPNPMPESVTDRCTKAHEYIFLLTKSAQYFFDADAIKEKSVNFPEGVETKIKFGGDKYGDLDEKLFRTKSGNEYVSSGKRNKRSVWTISTKPFKGAHFATFPPDLIEPCVLAGTSAFGACAKCKAPYQRILEKGDIPERKTRNNTLGVIPGRNKTTRLNSVEMKVIPSSTKGWEKTCACKSDTVEPCLVLDPFNGSGTTGVVAIMNGRHYIGTELNPEYFEMSRRRILAAWESITIPLFDMVQYE